MSEAKGSKWEKDDARYRTRYLMNELFFKGLEGIRGLPEEHRKP